MCTCINKHGYFARTLDCERSYNEKIMITPRGYKYNFKNVPSPDKGYAIIGMAADSDSPLYYDAANEKGLCMAALNFPESCNYRPYNDKMTNVASFELIPYILTQNSTVAEAMEALDNVNICDASYGEEYPCAPLHFMVSDSENSIVIEQTKQGLEIHNNPVEVLTNEPTFDIALFNLRNYLSLSTQTPSNTFSTSLKLSPYSRGMGTIGLPGDYSSLSRFVRAAFIKENSADNSGNPIDEIFHIISSLEVPKGIIANNKSDYYTRYTSCIDSHKGIYYYTTYDNRSITGVDIFKENLDSEELISYNLIDKQQINFQN